MKIFTIRSGEVEEGARVGTFTLKGAGVSIPAIIVGEEGRGRELGILPVELLPEQYKEWKEKGHVYIFSAQVGETKSGKPKLYQTEEVDTTKRCVCIFKTKIGFRGSNKHSGDLKEEYWTPNWLWEAKILALGNGVKEKYTKQEAVEIAERLDSQYPWDVVFEKRRLFNPFPGETICKGVIAQGDAGRMGSGEQLVAIIPAGEVFRTAYSGRLYGQPVEHYYIYKNGKVISTTKEEREVSGIF